MDLPRTFARSIYSPEFYRSLSERPLSFSFRYFLLLAGTLAFAVAIFYGIAVFPPVYNWLKEFGPAVSSAYPAELEISLRKGEVSVNSSSPVSIEMPRSLVPERAENLRNLLVIDTENPFSLDRFDEYDTLVLLMKDSIAFRDRGNGVRIQSLKDVPDFVIDRDLVLSVIYQIEGVTRVGFPLLLVMGVLLLALGFFLFLSLDLLVVLFWALLIILLASFWQRTLTYSRAYQVGIHASSLSVALAAASLLFPGANILSFLPTLLTLGIAWLNLRPATTSPRKV